MLLIAKPQRIDITIKAKILSLDKRFAKSFVLIASTVLSNIFNSSSSVFLTSSSKDSLINFPSSVLTKEVLVLATPINTLTS